MVKLGVVIPVHNLWQEYTKPCIDSLNASLQAWGGAFHIALIDNNSHDETEIQASEAFSKGLIQTYIRNAVNEGVAKSWNKGARHCWAEGCDAALIINNDVLFRIDTVATLVREYEDVGASIITPLDVRTECAAEDIESVPAKDRMNEMGPDFSCFLLPKATWDAVGEFDEGYKKAYFEDNDYHWRIVAQGLPKAFRTTKSLYYHFGSRTQNQVPFGVISSAAFEENRAYFIAKWGSGVVQTSDDMLKAYGRHPFNDGKKGISWTLQGACREFPCLCDVQCSELLTRWGNHL